MIFEQERVLSVLCIMAGWRDEGFHLGGDAYLLAKQQEHSQQQQQSRSAWIFVCSEKMERYRKISTGTIVIAYVLKSVGALSLSLSIHPTSFSCILLSSCLF